MTITRSRPLPLLDELAPPVGSHSQSEHEAGFGALETAHGRLPLLALNVAGRIDGLLSQVTVRQTFVNATGEPLEATYIFPLPDRAAVTDFRMEVGGRVVEGVLKERGQARREYSQAVRQGHRASIAEEERPGVFSLRPFGNLMPGDVATVQLTMVGALPYRDGEVTFRFPLVVAPRYIPGVPLSGPSVGAGTAVDTSAVPDASRISPPVLLPGFPNPVRLSLVIDVYEPADDLRVSLFTVLGEEQGDFRRLTLQTGERLDRDFILRFRLGGDSVRTSLSLHPDAAESGEGTFALTVVPPASCSQDAVTTRPRDVVLLLDRSGSMEGWKIVAARRALARMIDTLGDADRFALLAFDDRIETARSAEDGLTLTLATDRNRFQAVEFLAKLGARGGTEIAGPLGQAAKLLGERAHERDRILVLVTDGQVGNEEQVLRTLGVRLEGIRVFTLGIDRAVNEGFLRRLAELGQGGGSCELVESEDRLDAVMDTMHRRIGTPVVTEVCLEPAASGLEFVSDSLVPDRPPSLFAGSPLLLMGRYRGRPHGPLEVRGQTSAANGWREQVVASVRDNPAIAAAWARGQVRQLEDRYAAGTGNHSELERTIIATSLRFGVLCRYTAYVAVDRSAVVNEGGEVHQITQPVEMPAGWGAVPAAFTTHTAARGMRETAFCLSLAHPGIVASDSNLSSEMSADFDAALAESSPSWSLPRRGRAAASSPLPPPPLTPDELIRQAGFALFEQIGEDEFGISYRSQDRGQRSVRIWSLKTPVTLAGPADVARLEKELKALKHKSIVPIFKVIGDSGTGRVVAVVSEFVSGPTLTQWLSQAVLPDLRQAAFFVLVLAEALEFAGRRLLFHGNLASGQIVIGADGQPRITGFEFARLDCGPDMSNAIVRAFVAPERRRSPGVRPTAQTDVFSLGVILYRLLTGVQPEDGPDKKQLQAPRAINPGVPSELETICMRAIAAQPEVRFATAGQLAAELRAAVGLKKRGLLERITGWSKPEPTAPSAEKAEREGIWK